MKLHEIENLSVEDLKGRKPELIEHAGKADPAELAARYIQARTDAAARDAKLAEQGRTIEALNTAVTSERERLFEASRQIEGMKSAAASKDQALADRDEQIRTLTRQLGEERAARATAEALARARKVAVAEINAIAGRALVDG